MGRWEVWLLAVFYVFCISKWGVFHLAREKKDVRKDREYEALKESLRRRFINAAHVMWGREIKIGRASCRERV